MEQTRSELPLSRDGADAPDQSAPMAACFQLWSPGSGVRGNSGGIALTGSTLAACHRTDGLSSPDWYRAKGSEPQAQPRDRHSPPQSSRSGLASHQEEMRRSLYGTGVGRIGRGTGGFFGATERRSTPKKAVRMTNGPFSWLEWLSVTSWTSSFLTGCRTTRVRPSRRQLPTRRRHQPLRRWPKALRHLE